MLIRFYFALQLICLIRAHNVCENHNIFCSNQKEINNERCNIESRKILNNECATINFAINKIKQRLGNIQLKLSEEGLLKISFNSVKWKKCYLKLSDYGNKQNYSCKMYSVSSHISAPLNNVIEDDCTLNATFPSVKSLELEYKAENKLDIETTKLVFYKPSKDNFGSQVDIQNRSIFAYVDCTDLYNLRLRIQPLPEKFSISQYKVQVFRLRDKKSDMIDVRMFAGATTTMEIIFNYYTYNEEGLYYFVLSIINDNCPEDICFKTTTPKIYIARKGTPLVIGIVGASLIIPFVLFLFHMINRKYKNNGELLLLNEKIVLIFKPSSNLHCAVINTLGKLLKDLTGKDVILEAFRHTHEGEKICSDDILYASHIIYIPPPLYDTPNCEMDFMTHNFLKDELKKEKHDKCIMVACLPYSTHELPDILRSCPSFALMDEFEIFLNAFDKFQKWSRQINTYQDLLKKIDAAKIETERKNKLNMPKIVITEQSDTSDMECDGLL